MLCAARPYNYKLLETNIKITEFLFSNLTRGNLFNLASAQNCSINLKHVHSPELFYRQLYYTRVLNDLLLAVPTAKTLKSLVVRKYVGLLYLTQA